MRDVPNSVILSSSCFILMLRGARDLLYIFLQSFLYQFQDFQRYRNCCGLHTRNSFNFDFKVFIFFDHDSFSATLTEVFFSVGIGHINKQAAFFLFILDCNVGSVGLIIIIIIVIMMMMMMSIPCRLRMFGLVYSPWGGLQQFTTGPRSLFSFFLKEQHFPQYLCCPQQSCFLDNFQPHVHADSLHVLLKVD